jgi:MFS family permease
VSLPAAGDSKPAAPRLGLRENLGQFSLLVLVNGFVGTMVGMERAVLPLLAEREFGVASRTAVLSFVLTFGLVKAISNLIAGAASDRWGRRSTLLLGWLAGIPVAPLIMFAPTWGWVVAANVLLGLNQGLCWSTAVIMKVDLVGPARRGLAIGLNEASGYLAVSLAALASGYLAGAHGLRPYPFLIGVGAAVAGLACSLGARETRRHAETEASMGANSPSGERSFRRIMSRVSWKDRSLFSVCQAGLMNNLNDGVSWGLFPLHFASAGAGLRQTAMLVAVYPAVWAVAQLATGPLSDRFGRKPLIVLGMALQALALVAIAASRAIPAWTAAMVGLGLGTAFVYPTLIGAVSDHSHPSWRASAIGVYRLWRDLGYAVGALLAGGIADAFGIPASIALVGALTLLSGVVVATAYRERLGGEPQTARLMEDARP